MPRLNIIRKNLNPQQKQAHQLEPGEVFSLPRGDGGVFLRVDPSSRWLDKSRTAGEVVAIDLESGRLYILSGMDPVNILDHQMMVQPLAEED